MSSTQPTLLCHNRYDPLDRLINQNQPDQPAHQRFYCKSRLATEIQGAMQHSIVQHGNQLLAQRERQGDVVDTTLLATDLQRSVLQTLKANDERRAIAYSPYGHRPAENGLLSLLGFNGERRDLVTGYYLLGNGYRAFNPVLMRFNSPDSWSPFGRGGLNAYAYCLGNPVNQTDPTGKALEKIWNAARHMIDRWRVNRLVSQNEEILKLYNNQQNEYLKQFHSTIQSEFAYRDNGLTLATLANKKLASLSPMPRDMLETANKINFNLTKRAGNIVKPPKYIELEKDLELLNKLAIRNDNGDILEFKFESVYFRFNADALNKTTLIKKYSENEIKIAEIRGVVSDFDLPIRELY
jgi:RHS repeat-associated protein